MRTTLVINDELFASAKRLAAEKQCSLSALVNDALRRVLKQASKSPESGSFRMPTFGGGLDATDTSPTEFTRLVEDEEFGRFRS